MKTEYTCACKGGFVLGSDGKTCIKGQKIFIFLEYLNMDVNYLPRWIFLCLIDICNYLVHPCDETRKGGCSQICNKRKGDYVCSCETGFVLAQDTRTCTKGELIISHICILVEIDKLFLR